MATSGVVLSATGQWQHQRLVWWAQRLRQWGYAGRLPGWSRVTCEATWPMSHCPCGAFVLVWGDTLG